MRVGEARIIVLTPATTENGCLFNAEAHLTIAFDLLANNNAPHAAAKAKDAIRLTQARLKFVESRRPA